ncbi:MAG: sugar ABC transporter substrate-binding protein [Candidatus Dormibacteraceae bacterium]
MVALAVNAAQAEAKKQGVDVKFAYATDAPSQQTAVETLLGEGVNVLAIDPNDSTAIGTAVKLANSQNVPVITFVGTAASGQVAATIESNEVDGGTKIGNFIFQNYLHGSGQVAFIQGDETHSAFLNREKGFRAALAGYPNVNLVAFGIGNQTADGANPVALDMITKNPNLNAMFADSDAMAQGVYSAVESSGKTKQIAVFGYNGSCQTLSSIWQGQITGDLYQGWSGFGVSVVDTAIKLFSHQSVPSVITTPTYALDKAAMQQIHDGTYSAQDQSLTDSVNQAIAGNCGS